MITKCDTVYAVKMSCPMSWVKWFSDIYTRSVSSADSILFSSDATSYQLSEKGPLPAEGQALVIIFSSYVSGGKCCALLIWCIWCIWDTIWGAQLHCSVFFIEILISPRIYIYTQGSSISQLLYYHCSVWWRKIQIKFTYSHAATAYGAQLPYHCTIFNGF